VILVTGSSGFIGSSLCRELTAKGAAVRAFFRPRSNAGTPTLLQGLHVEHAIGDITQLETIERTMQGIETVFHTAAKLGSGGKTGEAFKVTVSGTRNVLRASAQAGVQRVILTSSVAALGVPGWNTKGTVEPTMVDENHTWNIPPGWWPYGYAKYQAELVAQEFIAGGLDVVIVNPGVVVGAGDINQIGGGLIVQIARNRLPISIPGGLNVVHIHDVVQGHLAAMENGRRGQRYILGGENLTHLALMQRIAQITGGWKPRLLIPAWLLHNLAKPFSKILPMSIGALRRAGYNFYFDNQKMRQELGLHQLHSVDQGVREAYAWYLEKGIL
jgi:dihydroflavonol-4-reductase